MLLYNQAQPTLSVKFPETTTPRGQRKPVVQSVCEQISAYDSTGLIVHSRRVFEKLSYFGLIKLYCISIKQPNNCVDEQGSAYKMKKIIAVYLEDFSQ